MYKKIVAGTDLSPTAKVATDRAAALAARLDADLVLVHAGTDPGEPFEALATGYGAEAIAQPGNPAEVLLTECGRVGADLLVVGSVGMSGARRFLLGSVPNKVSHHATTDLLIVKTDPPRNDGGRLPQHPRRDRWVSDRDAGRGHGVVARRTARHTPDDRVRLSASDRAGVERDAGRPVGSRRAMECRPVVAGRA